MMKIMKNEGNHSQIIIIERGEITDALCDCTWGSLHPGNWKEGKNLCKHLKSALKEC